MGGAPTAQDKLSGTLSDALPPKQPRNNRDDNWGRRLVGHPLVYTRVCMQSAGDLNQRERERERARDADNENKPKINSGAVT